MRHESLKLLLLEWGETTCVGYLLNEAGTATM
ncbi:unnamed protein product, partial [marine sediment metagenome]